MGRELHIFLVVCRLVLIPYASAEAESPSTGESGSSIYGEYAFSLTSMAGETIQLSDYQGKVVLVNFWATWCGPCVQETPALVRLYNTYQSQGLVVIGVAQESSEADVREFIERFQIPYAIGRDTTDRIASAYKLFGIPVSFLFSPEGKMVRRFEGFGAGTEAELAQAMHVYLDAPIKPERVPSTKVASKETPDSSPSIAVTPPVETTEQDERPSLKRETTAVAVQPQGETTAYGWWNVIVPLCACFGLFILSRIRFNPAVPEHLEESSAPPPVPYARFICQNPTAQVPQEIAFVHDDILIGSETKCDIVIPHPSVAPQHARVQWRKQGYILFDLHNQTDTFVNGRQITENLLKDGWLIRLGEVEFVFREAGTPV